MAVAEPPVYREVYRFLASAPTHAEILAFRPSQPIQQRIGDLLERNETGQLTPEERAEIDEFEQVEHFIRMLKLHTRELMNAE